MRLYIIDRKILTRILLIALLVGVTVIYTAGVENGVLSVFINNSKKLPIYCVDVPEKKIAISFDAGWGRY